MRGEDADECVQVETSDDTSGMIGELDIASKRNEHIQETSFLRKSPLKRIWISAQGAIFNLIAAFIAFLLYSTLLGYPSTTIAHIFPESPAQKAGLQSGDVIKRIDGQPIHVWEDVLVVMMNQVGDPIDVVIERADIDNTLTLTPMLDETGGFMLGVSPVIQLGFLNKQEGFTASTARMAVEDAFNTLKFNVTMPFVLLSQFIQGTLASETVELSGPIGIANVVGEVYQLTVTHGTSNMILSMLYLLGTLSAAVGIMNLIPIPALDGARIVFILIEIIRRKPVKRSVEAMVHGIGFAVLMCLAVFVAYLDITRLF